jgi:hypothetical protein
MGIRREPTYLSYEVYRSLRLLAKARTDEGHIITADQLADEMLSEVLNAKYPQLQELQKQVAKLEKETIKSLT